MLEQHQWITWSKLDSGQDAGLCPGAIYHCHLVCLFCFSFITFAEPINILDDASKIVFLDTTGHTFFLLPGKT